MKRNVIKSFWSSENYMNFKEHRKDFNKRWNITLSDTPQEAFQQFQQRVVNIFQGIRLLCGDINSTYYVNGIDNIVTEESSLDFCQYYGISENLNKHGCKITVIHQLMAEGNEKEFYRLIEVILSLQIRRGFCESGKEVKQFLIKKITEAVEMSDVNVTIRHSENGIILYPKGEEKLDKELVNTTLSFLDKESNKNFEKALKFYQSKNFRESANSLQSSLENYLRFKLKNKKGIKQNIQSVQENLEAIQKKLKASNSLHEIRNIISKVFEYLNRCFDENSKHWDKIDEPENEFLIYQTSLLLRYIDRTIFKKIKPSRTKKFSSLKN